MIAFWIAALTVTAAGAVLMFLYLRKPVSVLVDPAQTVYRRQLEEIDDLAERGLMGEDERNSAYAEAARRLLNEPGAEAEKPENDNAVMVSAAAIGAVGVIALVAYMIVGKPNLPGQPYAERLETWQNQVAAGQGVGDQEYVAVLRRMVLDNPYDPQLLAELGFAQYQIGDLLSAERRVERALGMSPDNPGYWQLLAQIRLELAQNEVTPEVREAVQRALTLEPSLPMARYIMGLDMIAQGQTETGLNTWRGLLDEFPPQTRAALESQIATVEETGSLSAPNVTDPQILAMVEGLAARLEDDPDDPQGWANLVRSYAVLGDQAKLDEALAEARRFFADRPRDLAMIEEAANLESQ